MIRSVFEMFVSCRVNSAEKYYEDIYPLISSRISDSLFIEKFSILYVLKLADGGSIARICALNLLMIVTGCWFNYSCHAI